MAFRKEEAEKKRRSIGGGESRPVDVLERPDSVTARRRKDAHQHSVHPKRDLKTGKESGQHDRWDKKKTSLADSSSEKDNTRRW